jgi:hypothetical protein
MSTPYRTAGRSRTYLSRVGDGWLDTVLAPDITTARELPLPSIGDLPEMPRVPPTRKPDARVMEHGATAPRTEISVVEARHPEIARAISLLWGFPEMNEYFDRLWLADGDQGPIDPDAMSELMLLSRVHQNIVPQRPGRSLAALYGGNRVNDPVGRPRDPWGDVPPRR